MIQSLRQIKNRIRSIENTKKVTHAMEMISLAKLRPTENRFFACRQYFLKLDSLVKNVLAEVKADSIPLLEARENKEKIALCVVTSDTGLCGMYNHDILRLAKDFLDKNSSKQVKLITIGKKGFNYFKRAGFAVSQSYLELHGRYSEETGEKILKDLTGIFLSKEASQVYIAYTHFETAARHRPVVEKFLNIETKNISPVEYIFEPEISKLLEELLPLYLSVKLKLILLDAFCCEHSARLLAMGESTQNAKELLEAMILLRNKVRQAGITKEIIEIVSSAEVLR